MNLYEVTNQHIDSVFTLREKLTLHWERGKHVHITTDSIKHENEKDAVKHQALIEQTESSE